MDDSPPSSTKPSRAFFTATTFLSSGLLFLVQPMVARIILPAFGGPPAVWSTSMVFFQAMLLLGYAYAHFSIRWLGVKRQAFLHVGLLALAALLLPFGLPKWSGAVGSENPTWNLLGTLFAMVGLPFFAISAGAPLIQRWFSTTPDKDAHDPYFLYSASNLGSFLALLAYPLVFEPRFRLGDQANLWRFGYLLLVLMMAGCSLIIPRVRAVAPSADPEPVAEDRAVTWRDRGMWLVLAAVPSSLLLGVTTFITTNIAPVPLLWIVPLGLYLLTFVLAFANRQLVSARVLGRLAPLIATPLALVMILGSDAPIGPIAGFHLLVFVVLAWMCHARLHDTRPSPRNLTEFYMWMSLGGVVGGLFNALLAPALFDTLAEYPIALVLALMLRPAIGKPKFRHGWIFPVAVFALAVASVILVRTVEMPNSTVRTLVTIGLPLILCMFAMDAPILYGLSIGAVFVTATWLHISTDTTLVTSKRSFFGVNTVSRSEDGQMYQLLHGNTTHGKQDRRHPTTPLTYYHPSGPIGDVFTKLAPRLEHQNIALIGLGVGSLAAYGQKGEHMTYFEIDPMVKQIATDPHLFTFIRDSKADVNFVLGDARLTLSREPDHHYEMIVLDAFSSDAIPVHLLVRQAFEMYLRKLTEHGIIAVHISNRYLDLQPVVSSIAQDLGLRAKVFEDGATQEERDAGKLSSIWIVIARQKQDFGPLQRDYYWDDIEAAPNQPVWTDDYSNVLGVFHADE